ncbi:hypothetical protein [Actinopolyspora halophila]|uniref:hypothetical protein n=1 Tax=Actinopolyspora halophila TaxID=1850 RepID=UPI0003AB33E1|nr:hypothetical protein [Actinopolyspora halophila]
MLVVTADMICDLVNYNPGLEAREVAIALGEQGWDVCVTVNGTPGPVLMTAEDAYAFLGGGSEMLDEEDGDELAEALATPDPKDAPCGAYRIPREDGSLGEPDPEVDYRVVAGEMSLADEFNDLDEQGWDWDEAWWFDLDRATRLVEEIPGAIDRGAAYELWLTEGGSYVVRTRSIGAGHPGSQWSYMPAEEASRWMYRLEDDRIDHDALPLLMRAARNAAELVEQLVVPELPAIDPQARRAAARQREDQAAETFEQARVLSELLRNTVLADIKQARFESARVVLRAHDGDRNAAGDVLGIAATNKLLQ